MKVITPKPSASHVDIIDFVRDLLEFCKDNQVTSIGACMCYADNGADMIYADHLSLDEEDQDNFENAALELRHSIIDSLDDWQVELYNDDE